MKNFNEITEQHVRKICELIDLPFIKFLSAEQSEEQTACFMIFHESTMRGDFYDKTTTIYSTGEIKSFYNSGNWGNHGYNQFNQLPIFDYLREEGFLFEY